MIKCLRCNALVIEIIPLIAIDAPVQIEQCELLRISKGDVKWLRVSYCNCPSTEVGCRRASLTFKVASNSKGTLPSH